MKWIGDQRPLVVESDARTRQPRAIWFDPALPDFEPQRWPAAFKPSRIIAYPHHGWRMRTRSGGLELSARGVPEITFLEAGEPHKRGIYLLNSSGVIYGGAISWCLENNVLVAMRVEQDNLFNVDHRTSFVVLTEENILQKPRVRQLQYVTPPLFMAKQILVEQFRRMAKECRGLSPRYDHYRERLLLAQSLRELMQTEGHIARTYWHLRAFRLQCSGDEFPTRWRVFRRRKTGIPTTRSGERRNNQHATHPVNAMLNYSYAVVASQLRRAIVASGLDPCFGYLHSDKDYRDNLVYDLLELLRCRIDSDVLAWIKRRNWKRSDFFVFLNGVVRLPDEVAAALVPVALRSDAALDDAVALLLRWLRHAPRNT